MSNVKGVAEPVALSTIELIIIFQRLVLVLWHATSLFWFILTALINIVSTHSSQLFSEKKALHCTLSAQHQTAGSQSRRLAFTVAPEVLDISLRSG